MLGLWAEDFAKINVYNGASFLCEIFWAAVFKLNKLGFLSQ